MDAVIAYVTSSELCESVWAPITSTKALAAFLEMYERVCDLETQAEVATNRIAEIVGALVSSVMSTIGSKIDLIKLQDFWFLSSESKNGR